SVRRAVPAQRTLGLEALGARVLSRPEAPVRGSRVTPRRATRSANTRSSSLSFHLPHRTRSTRRARPFAEALGTRRLARPIGGVPHGLPDGPYAPQRRRLRDACAPGPALPRAGPVPRGVRGSPAAALRGAVPARA